MEINLKTGLTTATLQKLKPNALDLGLCALPIAERVFETVPLFKDDLVAILPTNIGPIPKKVRARLSGIIDFASPTVSRLISAKCNGRFGFVAAVVAVIGPEGTTTMPTAGACAQDSMLRAISPD